VLERVDEPIIRRGESSATVLDGPVLGFCQVLADAKNNCIYSIAGEMAPVIAARAKRLKCMVSVFIGGTWEVQRSR